MNRFVRLLTLSVILCFAVSVLPAAAQDGGTPQGLRADAPTYGLSGPYAVGMSTFVIGEGADQPLKGIIWYPALNPLDLAANYAYPIPIAGTGMTIHINGHALDHASPDMSGAPYPLVISSHGFGVYAATYAFLTEHLASYGFVVMAVDYPDAWDPTMGQIWSAIATRPLALDQLIAKAETMAGADGEMAGLFSADKYALIGHSLGGYTSLVGAGARIDMDAQTALCNDNPVGTDVWLCPIVTPKVGEMATLAGYDTPPEGLWPSRGGSRVSAVVSMSFGTHLFPEAGVSEITVPLLSMVGTNDSLAPYDEVQAIYTSVSSSQKALVTFKEAGHFVFQWACEDFPEFVAIGYGAYCVDPVWDMMRTHDLTNHFVTAFLLATVKGDTDAAAVFGADAAPITGIEYEASGF